MPPRNAYGDACEHLLVEGDVHILRNLLDITDSQGRFLLSPLERNEGMLLLWQKKSRAQLAEFFDWFGDTLRERLKERQDTQPRTRMASTIRLTPTMKAALR